MGHRKGEPNISGFGEEVLYRQLNDFRNTTDKRNITNGDFEYDMRDILLRAKESLKIKEKRSFAAIITKLFFKEEDDRRKEEYKHLELGDVIEEVLEDVLLKDWFGDGNKILQYILFSHVAIASYYSKENTVDVAKVKKFCEGALGVISKICDRSDDQDFSNKFIDDQLLLLNRSNPKLPTIYAQILYYYGIVGLISTEEEGTYSIKIGKCYSSKKFESYINVAIEIRNKIDRSIKAGENTYDDYLNNLGDGALSDTVLFERSGQLEFKYQKLQKEGVELGNVEEFTDLIEKYESVKNKERNNKVHIDMCDRKILMLHKDLLSIDLRVRKLDYPEKAIRGFFVKEFLFRNPEEESNMDVNSYNENIRNGVKKLIAEDISGKRKENGTSFIEGHYSALLRYCYNTVDNNKDMVALADMLVDYCRNEGAGTMVNSMLADIVFERVFYYGWKNRKHWECIHDDVGLIKAIRVESGQPGNALEQKVIEEVNGWKDKIRVGAYPTLNIEDVETELDVLPDPNSKCSAEQKKERDELETNPTHKPGFT